MAINKKGSKKKGISDNFLEILRELGEGTIDTAVDQITGRKRSGELKPEETIELEQFAREEIEKERFAQEFEREILDIHRQEKLVYSKEQQEIKLQIKAIQDELKKLASSTQGLAKEVEVAAKQVPVEPGVYHLTFFEKLRQIIIQFRQRIEDSRTWLAAFNQRAKRRSYYWFHYKKSGTKFSLSPERYMATSAG